MVSIARKNLFHDWTRLLISVGGVAFSVFLMLYFINVLDGFEYLLESYVSNQDVDLWVLQKPVKDLLRGNSNLPLNLSDELALHGGVERVDKLLGRTLKVGEDENLTLIVVGYDTRSGVGGPWRIVEGKSKPDRGEIIIDRVFSKRNNILIGDTIDVLGKEFRVVGLSDYTSMLIWQYSFIMYEEAEELFQKHNETDYIMLKLRNPEYNRSIIDSIENTYEYVNVFTKKEFSENNKELVRDGFVPILFAALFVGLIVGTSFVAVTIYTITIERIKEYGILKAIGATNVQLYRIIFEQSLTSSIIGFLLGSIIAAMASVFTYNYFPELTSLITINGIFNMFWISILISIVASYIPIRRVSKVDPLIIFR